MRNIGSNESMESLCPEEELKKKLMQGFDEKKDHDEMICKRFTKNFSLTDDDYEDITDTNAWTVMFPVHKASKFGTGASRVY